MKDWINNMDEKLDSMGAKLAKKEITIPTDLVAAVLFFLVGIVLLLCIPSQTTVGADEVVSGAALYASTFGGIFSALALLFLAPQVAKIAAQLGTAEYFLVCLFGLTIIAGISGKSLVKGIISAALGLFISCIGADPLTGYDRFTFGNVRLYMGLDLAICLIGLFALVEILAKAEGKEGRLKLDTSKIKTEDKFTSVELHVLFIREILWVWKLVSGF